MTVQSTTSSALEALDEARERLAPTVDRLTDAAGEAAVQVRDQVRDQVAPRVADAVAVALSGAADKIGAHGSNGSPSRRMSPWRPVVITVIAVAGGIVVYRVIRARRAAQEWPGDDASRFPSDLPSEYDGESSSDRKVHDSVDDAKQAVTDLTDRSRNSAQTG